jgi:hypothetical protein
MGVDGQRFGLWTWPLEASHHAWQKAPLTIFYWLFLAHLFGLSTKLGHSIPRPLDLDGHKVETPIHFSTRELVTWECKEHRVKS